MFAEESLEGTVVELKVKNAGSPRSFHGPFEWIAFPFPYPVTGAHPDPVFSSFGDLNLSLGILDFFSKAMSHEVGGTHLIHRLLIDDPASELSETFGIDHLLIGPCHRK